jgi:hypothetical protein
MKAPPKIAPVIRNAVAFPAAKARIRSNRSGSIGAAARRSQTRNAAMRTAPATSVPTTSALVQPTVFARTSAQTSATTPAETSATPGRSSRAAAPLLSGSSRAESSTAMTPSGTLAQKIQCQSIPWVSAPPTSGPLATASPARPP